MALKKTLTDPLNWLLLLLVAAFGYYIFAVPYFTDFYLKTPQQVTLAEYLSSPSHPRPFMLHALSAPPSSIEVVVTGLRVAHIDQDSILLVDADAAPPPAPPAASPAATDGDDTAGDDQDAADAEPMLTFQPEGPPPSGQVMIPGDNLDLLAITVGQIIDLQVNGLYESPLGWVPQNPTLDRDDEELFTKEELDALEVMRLIVDGNEIPVPYIASDELRFAANVHPLGLPATLEELANDTTYIQTVQRLAGGTVDIYDARLTEKRFIERAPYFVIEDGEGRRAQVFFNSRLLSEWYWGLDRLGGQDVAVRGTLRAFTPSDLRELESEDNVQVVLDGYAILSRDGTTVVSLENPLGGLGGAQ
ncbi:MAG TPA: hypothetical protein QGG47_02760 [Acidobacteriota bacterium]|nr:hypothetical protein [Acidobacteriota bacterium]